MKKDHKEELYINQSINFDKVKREQSSVYIIPFSIGQSFLLSEHDFPLIILGMKE